MISQSTSEQTTRLDGNVEANFPLIMTGKMYFIGVIAMLVF